jgi:threonine/homoserine/homoserine lactone efflux protein
VLDVTVLPAFMAVILLFLGPPGPDMAYMLAVGLHGGRRAAVKAILGIGTGMIIYAAAAVAGIGQVAESHPTLFDALKLVGAAYLLWVAYVTLRGAHHSIANPDETAATRWYRQGFLISSTNPKIMLFYLAVLPQFTGDAQNVTLQLALLGAVNVLSEVVLYGGLGVFAGVFHSRFNQNHTSAAVLNYIASFVYAGLAVVILAEVFMA